jgi:hypothetical protein
VQQETRPQPTSGFLWGGRSQKPLHSPEKSKKATKAVQPTEVAKGEIKAKNGGKRGSDTLKNSFCCILIQLFDLFGLEGMCAEQFSVDENVCGEVCTGVVEKCSEQVRTIPRGCGESLLDKRGHQCCPRLTVRCSE